MKLCSCLIATQNLHVWSGFLINTTFDAHSLTVGDTTPAFTISSTCRSMIGRCAIGCLLNGCLNGRLVPVSMWCLAIKVRPMSNSDIERSSALSQISSSAFLRCSVERSIGRESIMHCTCSNESPGKFCVTGRRSWPEGTNPCNWDSAVGRSRLDPAL